MVAKRRAEVGHQQIQRHNEMALSATHALTNAIDRIAAGIGAKPGADRPYFIAKDCRRLVKAAVETECAEFPARKNRQPSCRRQASQPFVPTIFLPV